jgi:glycosyltransferase involved in cell wall biosynthesis
MDVPIADNLMCIDVVTPVILTFNEEHNIGRTLSSLSWAQAIVVVDSGSVDNTRQIVSSFPNTILLVRAFDNHENQWRYAISNSKTKYVLALDADMFVPMSFCSELMTFLDSGLCGGIVPFNYCIQGRRMMGSLYPKQLRVFDASQVSVGQKGHTQTFTTAGKHFRFKTCIDHDDRKPFRRWLDNQHNYALLESRRMSVQRIPLNARDFLRRTGLGLFAMPILGYFRSGGVFGGLHAIVYALERLIFEAVLLRQIFIERLRIRNRG